MAEAGKRIERYDMIRVHMLIELLADPPGPHEMYDEKFLLSPTFADTAREAHAKLLTLLVTEEYLELPQADAVGLIPINSHTVRSLMVRDERDAGLL